MKRKEKVDTDNEEAAKAFKEEVAKEFPGVPIYIDSLSLSVSCHIGPGALAVAFSKNETIEEAMDFASKVGALSVMKEGAQTSLPTLEDVLNFKGANK